MMDEFVYDVIVIGAGISGLYAARCLKEEGLKYVVLESSDRVGGRTWTSRDVKTGGYVDMGGAYFGHQQKMVIGLAKELGLEFYNVPDHGKTTLKYKGRVRHFEGDIPPSSNVFELLDLVSVIKELDRLSLEVPLFQPWKARSAQGLDALSVKEFLEKFCWTSFAKTLIEIGLTAVFAHPCDKVSLLYALHLIRSCGGTRALFDQKGGLQEMKLVGGADSISLRMAKELASAVRFKTRVKAINQLGDEVEITTDDHSILRAKAIIVATSPAVLGHIKWMPDLPSNLAPFVELPMVNRPYLKTTTYYEKSFWEEKGLNGSFVSSEGIVNVAYPDTKHDGSFPAIMGFVLGEKYQLMSRDDRASAVAKHYAELLGIDALATPSGYEEKWWGDPGEYERSGPCVFTLPPKFITKHQMLWGEPFGKVYFAGSESSPVFRGYMDGGVRAAAVATKRILESLKLKPKRDYSQLMVPVPYLELSFLERLLPGVTSLLWGSVVLLASIVLVLVTYFWWKDF